MRMTRHHAPVNECAFHLDIMQQAGHIGENMPSTKQCLSVLHELCHRVLPISNALLQLRRDKRDSLCLIQLKSSSQPLLSE